MMDVVVEGDVTSTTSTSESESEVDAHSHLPLASQDESLRWLLQCPLSFEQMQDPVVLFPSGHSYDRKYICESLLHFPNLDPKSGVYFDQPLSYATNFGLRNLLQEKGALVVPYDDAYFAQAYQKAWREKVVQQSPQHHGAPARHHHHERRNPPRQRRRRQTFLCNLQDVGVALLMGSAICIGVWVAAEADQQFLRQLERQCELFRTWSPAVAWYSSC